MRWGIKSYPFIIKLVFIQFQKYNLLESTFFVGKNNVVKFQWYVFKTVTGDEHIK
jgi:hypothetical protein